MFPFFLYTPASAMSVINRKYIKIPYRRKKSWMKNIILSWRKNILKIFDCFRKLSFNGVSMGFLSKFTNETYWNPIETKVLGKFSKFSIFKINFLHDKINFFIQNFFCDLEFLYTFDLSHSRRSRGRTEKMGTKVTQIFLYLQNTIDIETQLQKSSV